MKIYLASFASAYVCLALKSILRRLKGKTDFPQVCVNVLNYRNFEIPQNKIRNFRSSGSPKFCFGHHNNLPDFCWLSFHR